jgi:hypothetical protein
MRRLIIMAAVFTSTSAMADTTVIVCPQGQGFCTYSGTPGALGETVRIIDCQGGQAQCHPVDKPIRCVTEDCRQWLLEKASEDIALTIEGASHQSTAFGKTTVKACPLGRPPCTTVTLTGCPGRPNEKDTPDDALKELADGRAIECLVGQFRSMVNWVYRGR